MIYQPPSSPIVSISKQKKLHQHYESKQWILLAADQKCLECWPVPKPFAKTLFGQIPTEVRVQIYKYVLAVSPLKDGISVPMTRKQQDLPPYVPVSESMIGPLKPASCLALLETCSQIYIEASHLFYGINTCYLRNHCDLAMFIHQIGQWRCGHIRSLHLDNLLETGRIIEIKKPLKMEALRQFNQRGNIKRLYLTLAPADVEFGVWFCLWLLGFTDREIRFTSPSRWSVMSPSDVRKEEPWVYAFMNEVDDIDTEDLHVKFPNIFKPWRKDEKYRVEVDVLQA